MSNKKYESYGMYWSDSLENSKICPECGTVLKNEYQYYLFNNSLYTNFDFSADPTRTVDVNYGYLTDGIRLKAVLHNNSTSRSEFTPVLREFRLKFRSRS